MNDMFEHLRETGLSYMAHMRQALSYCWRLQVCAAKVFCHAILPDTYTKDASEEVSKLYKEMNDE